MNKSHVHFRSFSFSSKALLLCLFLSAAGSIRAQHMEIYLNGSAGIDRAYPGLGVNYFLKNKAIIGFEFGTGQLGSQSELASAGNSPNLNGSNGWESSISSSNVIAPDPNVPDHYYIGAITTRFTGQYYRASYEWFFASKHSTEENPCGLRAGVEFAYFDLIQRQDIQWRSFNTPDLYEYNGTSHCTAIAPGIRVGYEMVLFKKLRLCPELASPFYIPLGIHAKSNGPFAKQTLEARVGIAWMIR
jgi:hypothetical protein